MSVVFKILSLVSLFKKREDTMQSKDVWNYCKTGSCLLGVLACIVTSIVLYLAYKDVFAVDDSPTLSVEASNPLVDARFKKMEEMLTSLQKRQHETDKVLAG